MINLQRKIKEGCNTCMSFEWCEMNINCNVMGKKRTLFWQLIKYGLVGVLNTLLTAVVIWSILFFFSRKDNTVSPTLLVMVSANVTGYLVGLVNSFILNRNWTFKSRSGWKRSFIRFIIAFGICYGVQLGVVLWLNGVVVEQKWQMEVWGYGFSLTSAYACQLAGIVVFSILNFLLNKYYTFGNGNLCTHKVTNNHLLL